MGGWLVDFVLLCFGVEVCLWLAASLALVSL